MIDLLLSIAFSTSLFVVFSILKRFDIAPLPAIVVNYFTAAITGYCFLSGSISPAAILSADWLPMALVMGTCFISSFNLMGKTTQQLGVNVAAVTSKMSMVIPILFALIYFKESIDSLKIIAIFIAFAAVYLTSVKEDNGTSKGSVWLPVLLFLGCGVVDLLINFSQKRYGANSDFALMPPTLFLVAGCVGLAFIVIAQRSIIRSMSWLTVAFGVLLGVCNYFSLHFMFRALRFGDLPSSVMFPLNNVGVVALSAVCAVLFFREKMSVKNSCGLAASVVALALMMY